MIQEVDVNKERILNLTIEKFLSVGFSKVTVEEMASELGISKKTIYKFFPTKEDLLRGGLHMIMRGIVRQIEATVGSDKNFAEKLISVIMIITSRIGKIKSQAQHDMKRVTPHLWAEVEAFRSEHIYKNMSKLIEQGRQEGGIRPEIHPQILIMMIVSAIQAVINPDFLSQNSFSAQEAFHTIIKIIFEGALTEEGRQKFEFIGSQEYTY